MKKIIALALALVMMMAIAVPAFAAELNQKPEQSGEITISTDTKDADGNDAEKYTVTIPADQTIAWGTESTDVGYSITSQLRRNHRVEVTVAGSGTMKTVDGAYEIAYSLVGDTSYTTAQPTIVEADARALEVVVEKTVWDAAIVEEYSDILTYTSEIVDVA